MEIGRVAIFTVLGEARGKATQTNVMTNKAGKSFAGQRRTKSTVLYENRVMSSFEASYPFWAPLTGPVELILIVQMVPARVTSRRKRLMMFAKLIWPTKKPDLSNVLKSVEDGLTSVAWLDDKQVVRVVMEKRYADKALVRVRINEILEEE